MFFRKTLVISLITLASLWYLSANYSYAQSPGEGKESAAAAAVAEDPNETTAAGDNTQATDRPSGTTQSKQSGQSKQAGRSEKRERSISNDVFQVKESLKNAKDELQKAQTKAKDESRKAQEKAYAELQKAQEQLNKVQVMVKGLDGASSVITTGTAPGIGYPLTWPNLPGVQQRGVGWSGRNGLVQIGTGGPNPFVMLGAPDDPEIKALWEKDHKFEEETQNVVKQYNSSKDKDTRAKLKKNLEEIASQQFDVRQQYRELEVKRLEKELDRIHDSIEKRSEKRDQIIKRRISELIHEDEEGLEF